MLSYAVFLSMLLFASERASEEGMHDWRDKEQKAFLFCKIKIRALGWMEGWELRVSCLYHMAQSPYEKWITIRE